MVQFFNGVGAAARSPLSDSEKNGLVVMEIPLEDIRRPLMRTRANDPAKVQELMDNIHVIGLQVPMGTFPFKIPFTTSVI
jgi:sulfiredoxin